MKLDNIKVIKRNGSLVDFEAQKIFDAISKANKAPEVPEVRRMTEAQITAATEKVSKEVLESGRQWHIEEIQDAVILAIQEMRAYEVAISYALYRFKRGVVRQINTTDEEILSLINRTNHDAMVENANKNPTLNSTQRDYMAGAVSKDITGRILLPVDIWEAHKAGIIHFHDSDYYIQPMHNCCVFNLDDMLQNGTVISGVMIEKPKSFLVACNVTTQIVAQIASNQYGGQTFSLAHVSKFVDVSRQKIRKTVMEEYESDGIVPTEEMISRRVENRLSEEIKQGIQTIQYQLITLMTTNGQTPFVSMYMDIFEAPEGQERDDLIRCVSEVLRQRKKGIRDESGAWITSAFPKLLYVLDEDNDHPGSKYWDLTKEAVSCSVKRFVPDYISAKKMREFKGAVYGCMGCRSFLTVEDKQRNPDGSYKFYGRFNQGVVTINLVDVACASNGEMDTFWSIFEERLEMCHRALRLRHEHLLGTPSDVAPILWQHGALARLGKGEPIDKLLYDGYSTISLGYAGLYECCVRMTGKSHTDAGGKPFALRVMQYMNNKCLQWRNAENIAYSLYGTPMENSTQKFALSTQGRYGVIPNVTDHAYITNSYHVNVREEIDAFTKLAFEADFQQLSPGGCISYVELPSLLPNEEAAQALVSYISDTTMYAELNIKSDHCDACGFDGEVQIYTKEDGDLDWICPQCGNTDHRLLHVARRTCGYIGTQYWNHGRTAEIKDRVLHL